MADYTSVLLAYGGDYFNNGQELGLYGTKDPGKCLANSPEASPAEAAAVTGQLTLAIENAAPFALHPERDALLAEGEGGLTPDMSDEEAAAYRARNCRAHRLLYHRCS